MIVSLCYGRKDFKSTYASGIILMGELEWQPENQPGSGEDLTVFKSVVVDRAAELQSEHDQMEQDSSGKKLKLYEKIQRLDSWISEFKNSVKLYK